MAFSDRGAGADSGVHECPTGTSSKVEVEKCGEEEQAEAEA